MTDMQYIPEHVSRCMASCNDWCNYWYWSFHDERAMVVKALISQKYISYERLILTSTNWMDGDVINPDDGHTECRLEFETVGSSLLTLGMQSGWTQDVSQSRGGLYNFTDNTFQSVMNEYGLSSFNKRLVVFITAALEQAAVLENAISYHDEHCEVCSNPPSEPEQLDITSESHMKRVA